MLRSTYQPATVAAEPAEGSEPDAARRPNEIVELAWMGVDSFRMETSLFSVEPL